MENIVTYLEDAENKLAKEMAELFSKMRQTIIDNACSIEELKDKEASLEQKNKSLQAELKELKGQNAALEKEKAKLRLLEKYKDAVLKFMGQHDTGYEYTGYEYTGYDNGVSDDKLDRDIIKHFSDWHSNKAFMDSDKHYDVMRSKKGLNEYRINKKVNGEMVSNGVDSSGIARNVGSVEGDKTN